MPRLPLPCHETKKKPNRICDAGSTFADQPCRFAATTDNTYRGGVASGQQSAWGSNEELEAWRALVPPFVKPPTPGRISREGLRYLQHMGALDIPDRALEKHLLLAYIEHVHPDFPIVELHAFLHQVSDRNGKRGQVSLLLYQCVMFAASAFVAPEHLAAAGFSNRRALRRVVFQAAKLLHDFDYENDKLVLLQATLLLSFWYEAPDDSKETWHWSGVAISQAQALGLHRGMLHPPRESNEECARRKLRRRIWWSCVMRDRQIGLGMSRLIRIKDEDFDVPMLEEGDFDIDVLADNTIISPEDCPMLYDVGMQQELAEMCVQKAKLYVLVGHVLQTVQSFQIATKNGSHSVASIIEGNLVTFDRVYRKLLAWASALPPSSHYRKLERQDIEHGRIPVAMQRTLLHMLYQTTVGKVYHPLIRPARGPQTTSGDEFPAVQGVSLEARQKCKGAAAEITRMVGELHELGLDRFFPTTGVTVIMPAMLMHLQEIASTEANVRETAHRGFETCMKVLYTLKETYAAAEYAAIFMDNVIKNKPGLERTASGTITASNRAQGPHPMVPLSQPFSGALLAPRTFATGITLSSSSMHAGGEHGHYKSTDTLSQQTSRQNLPIHHGLSDLGLANLSANSQPPTFSNLIAPFAQLPPEPRPQLPATTASPAALQTGSTTVDSWPIELVGMKQHDGGSSVSASASVSSPEEIASSFEDYTLVSGPSALGRDEHISAEGLSLSFPQLGDDLSWQNWLNLPPEQDPAAGHEDGWTSLSEQIEVVEPGVTIDVAPEGFVES